MKFTLQQISNNGKVCQHPNLSYCSWWPQVFLFAKQSKGSASATASNRLNAVKQKFDELDWSLAPETDSPPQKAVRTPKEARLDAQSPPKNTTPPPSSIQHVVAIRGRKLDVYCEGLLKDGQVILSQDFTCIFLHIIYRLSVGMAWANL